MEIDFKILKKLDKYYRDKLDIDEDLHLQLMKRVIDFAALLKKRGFPNNAIDKILWGLKQHLTLFFKLNQSAKDIFEENFELIQQILCEEEKSEYVGLGKKKGGCYKVEIEYKPKEFGGIMVGAGVFDMIKDIGKKIPFKQIATAALDIAKEIVPKNSKAGQILAVADDVAKQLLKENKKVEKIESIKVEKKSEPIVQKKKGKTIVKPKKPIQLKRKVRKIKKY